jgi:hypothetical protein
MGGSRRSFTDELRDVAKGWRWGHRPVLPQSAEGVTEPAERWEFPTDWARTDTGRAARDLILSGIMKPIVWNETAPEVHGLSNLDPLRPPVMFISNHSSHLDATLILTTLPPKWRNGTATAAAKDYFFDVWWRSAFTALVYGGFPIERGGGEKATLKAKELIADGWNLIVFRDAEGSELAREGPAPDPRALRRGGVRGFGGDASRTVTPAPARDRRAVRRGQVRMVGGAPTRGGRGHAPTERSRGSEVAPVLGRLQAGGAPRAATDLAVITCPGPAARSGATS